MRNQNKSYSISFFIFFSIKVNMPTLQLAYVPNRSSISNTGCVYAIMAIEY